jgi:hypothetical protein
MDLLRRIWAAWKKIGHVIGDFIGRVVLSLLYFSLVLPFGLGLRLTSDPLRLKPSPRPSYWLERLVKTQTLETARRQF